MQPRMTTSRPLRLVPQAAQPIEFSCPLCGSVHAGYIFGTGQFRVFRCGGCALTFSKRAHGKELPAQMGTGGVIPRNQRDHAGLLAAVDTLVATKGPVLLVARPQDSLIALLQQRGLTIGDTVDEND